MIIKSLKKREFNKETLIKEGGKSKDIAARKAYK